MQLTDYEMTLLMKNFLAVKEYLPSSPMPDNQKTQLGTMVNDCLSILRKVGNGAPVGGSALLTHKTKSLFEMFHLMR